MQPVRLLTVAYLIHLRANISPKLISRAEWHTSSTLSLRIHFLRVPAPRYMSKLFRHHAHTSHQNAKINSQLSHELRNKTVESLGIIKCHANALCKRFFSRFLRIKNAFSADSLRICLLPFSKMANSHLPPPPKKNTSNLEHPSH